MAKETGLTALQWERVRDCICDMSQAKLQSEIDAGTIGCVLYEAVYGPSRAARILDRQLVDEALRLWGRLGGTGGVK